MKRTGFAVFFFAAVLTAAAAAAALTAPVEAQAVSQVTDGSSASIDLGSCTITIPKERRTYNGSAQTPKVTVVWQGRTLTENADYTVSYANNVDAGQAEIVISAVPGNSGGFTGTVTRHFHIFKPEAVIKSHGDCERVTYGTSVNLNASVVSGYKAEDRGTLTYRSDRRKTATVSKNGIVTIREPGTAHITITAQKTNNYRRTKKIITIRVRPRKTQFTDVRAIITRGITLWWRPRSGITGYEIRYSKRSSMRGARLCHVKGAAVVSKTLRHMKAGTRYFIQIRTYKVVQGEHYHSRWSRIRSCVPIIRRAGY